MSLKSPVPIELLKEEKEALRLLAKRSGISRSVILRRCLRLLAREVERRGTDWDWVKETSSPPEYLAYRDHVDARSGPKPMRPTKFRDKLSGLGINRVATRLEDGEKQAISRLSDDSALSKAAVLRRSLRKLADEVKKRGTEWNWVDETAQELPVNHGPAAESDAALKKILKETDAQRRGTGANKKARKTS